MVTQYFFMPVLLVMVLYYIYRLPYPQSAESVLSSGEFNVHTLQGSDFRNGLNVPGPVILGLAQSPKQDRLCWRNNSLEHCQH